MLALYSLGGTVRDATQAPRALPTSAIQLPDERAGLAFVFRVFDRVSYALVMQHHEAGQPSGCGADALTKHAGSFPSSPPA